MNRRQAITKACLLLRRQGKEESLARFLLMYMLDESPQLFSNSFSEQMSKENENKYFSLIEKHIKEDVPLSHLVGFEYFYDRKYKVTKDVLSPRMETEELIYKVIEYVKASSKNNFKILDLCTGSGIIAITLKKELSQFSIDVVASDISEEAIKVAKENAQSHDATIKFIQSDIFNNIADKFDIIVSNPPYIDRKDEVTMQDNVLKYDPHLALFAEEEGMYFYRKIIEQANDYLNENGVIFFEIGYDQKDKIIKLADLNLEISDVQKLNQIPWKKEKWSKLILKPEVKLEKNQK